MSYGPFTKALDKTIFIEVPKGAHDIDDLVNDQRQAIVLDDMKEALRLKKD